MKTGIIDKSGREIEVGDIVHFRCDGLSSHGKVVKDSNYGFAIEDDRARTQGRRYSLQNKGIYRIENR